MTGARGPECAARVAVIAWPAATLPALVEANDAVVCCAHVPGGRAAIDALAREILGAALGDALGDGANSQANGVRRGGAPFLGTLDELRPNVRSDVQSAHHASRWNPGTHGNPGSHSSLGTCATLRTDGARRAQVHPDVQSHVTATTLHETDIARAPGGKPYLASCESRPPLKFNISHTQDVLLVALSRMAEVGVDVERVRAVPEWRKIAGRMFDPATRAQLTAEIEGGANEDDVFIRHWCRLEAAVKATGAGLFGPAPASSLHDSPHAFPHGGALTRIIDLPDLPLPAGRARYRAALAIRP